MGREIKRVSSDFNWPLEKVWQGYKNPWYKFCHDCASCDGTGYAEMAKLYYNQWYGKVPFDPVAYGSQLLTPESPAVKAFVERQVDRSIREAAAGTAMEYSREKGTTYTGSTCYYTDNGRLTREEAIALESDRLLDMWNEQWNHHLIQADVDALLEHDYLRDFTHVKSKDIPLEQYIRTHAYYLWLEAGKPDTDGFEFWLESEKLHDGYWLPYKNGYIPTVKEVNEWNITSTFGVSNYSYTCIEARCAREGYEHLCPKCNGNGRLWHPADAEQKAEEWERTEPPTGEAYQIWETVSEGSPISPAFTNPQILAEYMANSPPWGAAQPMSAENWLKWIVGPGWAPSGVGGLDGVAAMVEMIGDDNV